MNRYLHRLGLRRAGKRRLLPWLVAILSVALLAPGLPVAHAQSGQSVYALPGTLRSVEGKTFDSALHTFDGNIYGLLGKTPEIELEIVRLRNLGPTEVVKVWGTLYPTGLTSQEAEIVVESILSASNPPVTPVTATPSPAPSPVPTAAPGVPTVVAPQATVATNALNVRGGPGTDYPIVNTLTLGATCPIVGRNAASTWWNIRCAGGVTGWVSGPLVVVTGSTANVPVVNVNPPPPPPTPTPTTVPMPPVTSSAWRASYFNNRDLAGSPSVVTEAGNLDFNWGTGAPAANVPADNFSARFERVLSFAPGSYLIELNVDDGVRVYVDGGLVLENWQESSIRTVSTQGVLGGNHTFRVEYFEAYGNAAIRFNVRMLSSDLVWQASYFDNPQLAGNPVVVRGEPVGNGAPIAYNWGTAAPVPGKIPADNWSARFEGTFRFESGDYNFSANVDDGMRLYINGIKVLDSWQVGYRNTHNVFRQLGAGNHRITVEYFEAGGPANLRVWWDKINPPNPGGGDGGRDQ